MIVFLDPPPNRFEYLLHLKLHIQVVETQKTNTELFQSCLSPRVFLLFQGMAFTIDLNCKVKFRTIKVNNVIVDGLLPVKVVSKHLLPFEFLPQSTSDKVLCLRNVFAMVFNFGL